MDVLDANIYHHHKGSAKLRGVGGEGNTINAPSNATDALSNTLYALPPERPAQSESSCRSCARCPFLLFKQSLQLSPERTNLLAFLTASRFTSPISPLPNSPMREGGVDVSSRVCQGEGVLVKWYSLIDGVGMRPCV